MEMTFTSYSNAPSRLRTTFSQATPPDLTLDRALVALMTSDKGRRVGAAVVAHQNQPTGRVIRVFFAPTTSKTARQEMQEMLKSELSYLKRRVEFQ